VGIYNRVTGQRYPAFDRAGTPVLNNTVLATTILVPPQ